MKHVDVEQAVTAAVPVRKAMTRSEKLMHWAGLVRAHQGNLALYHLLEHVAARELDIYNILHARTALGVAAGDPVLTEQGFTDKTVGGALRFFDMSIDQLHAFSCNCGGEIGNADQAARIERLAAQTGGGGVFGRAASMFFRR